MTTTVLAFQQQRRDTAANWTFNNPTLLAGELGYETDTGKWKIGDGSTAWTLLSYTPWSQIAAFPITNASIASNAEIAVSKLADGAARQLLQTDAAGTGVEWTDNVDVPGTLDVTGTGTFDGNVTIAGDLTVNGTTTTINTQDLLVEDKNVVIGNVATPSDVTADGGGITLKGTSDKTINWVDATDSWTSSEHIELASGKSYRINGTEVLSSTTLGSGVTGSSLTSVGTISSGTWQGTAIDAAYLDGTVVTTGDTGTVTSTMIADGTIVDGDINASAAIAGTKISPDFGSQNVTTTGTATAASFIPTSSTVPTNGVYLPAANSVALSTNGTGRLFIDSSGRVGVGTTSPSSTLHVAGTSLFSASNSALFDGTTGTYSTWRYNGTAVGDIGTGNQVFSGGSNTDFAITARSATSLVFGTNTTERFRCDSSGRLLVGTSTDSGGALLQINGNRIRIATAKTPASATDTGVAGEVCWDSGYIYVCTATNTWKRAALATW